MLVLFTINCTGQKIKKEKGVGSPQKTANPNTPYIYKNGYLNYNILKIPIVQKTDTVTINELKFNAVLSSMYTKRVMYDKFGKWTKEVRPNNERHPILIWEKIKLFENEDKRYTIYADGSENWNEIYASVLVFDENDKDCLSDESTIRKEIINLFSDGIKNLSKSEKFSKIYWDSVNNYDSKKNKNDRQE